MTIKLSRYGSIDRNNPEAGGRCDRGGEIRKHSELQREMVWSAGSLVWNGFLCCKDHIDPPHPQDQLYVLKPDPVPIKDPRPDVPFVPVPYYVSDGIPGGDPANYVPGGPLLTQYVLDDQGNIMRDDQGNALTFGPLLQPRTTNGGFTSGFVTDGNNRPLCYTPPDPNAVLDGQGLPVLDSAGNEVSTGPLRPPPLIRFPYA